MSIKETFSKLRKVKTGPCLSILMPTHRVAPSNVQDKAILKGLAHEAEEKLRVRFAGREIKALLENLAAAVETYDPVQNQGGLGVFVDGSVCELVHLAVPVETKVLIENNFATRELIKAMTTETSYYILTLSEKNTHLMAADQDHAHEVHAAGFPLANKHHHVSAKQRANWTKEDDKQARDYFSEVDQHLEQVLSQNRLPLVVAGSEHTLDNFRHVTRHGGSIFTSVLGNFDNSSVSEVGKVAWAQVKDAIAQHHADALKMLSGAMNDKLAALGIQEVYAMAIQGRGKVLFVEEDYFQFGVISGESIELESDSSLPGYVSDVVDEIAEAVLDAKGRVLFVEKGMLEPFGSPIALVLRY
ncbi:MAG: hypothetical protein RLZZ165_787 [Bacteroidota bacterium]